MKKNKRLDINSLVHKVVNSRSKNQKSAPDLTEKVFLEITTVIGCSVGCSYCPQTTLTSSYKKKVAGPQKMTMETYKKCLATVPKDVDIVFSGMSEPFINSSCAEMIEYAHDEGYRVRIFTTLTRLHKKDLSILEKVNHPDSPSLIVHLPDKKNLMRGLIINKRYLETLQLLVDSQLHIGFECVGDELHPDLVPIVGNDPRLAVRKIHSRSNNVIGEDLNFGYTPKKMKKCPRNLKSNILLPSGDVVICPQDYGLRHVIGNLLEQDYASLFESTEFKKVENALKGKTNDAVLCDHCDLPF